jgi:acyl carrier protein
MIRSQFQALAIELSGYSDKIKGAIHAPLLAKGWPSLMGGYTNGNRVRVSPVSKQGIYMSADVLAKVQAVVSDKLEVEASKITPEANFTDDLGADSLDVVELVMALEEEFDVEIPDEEAEKLQTVQSVVDYINAKQG